MSALTGIKQIAQIVEDVEEATEFYRDRLGLSHLFAFPGLSFFDCGGLRLMLRQRSAEETTHPGSLIYFDCRDIHRQYEDLTAAGVGFLDGPHVVGKTEDMETWAAFFNDPSGNMLALMSDQPIAD